MIRLYGEETGNWSGRKRLPDKGGRARARIKLQAAPRTDNAAALPLPQPQPTPAVATDRTSATRRLPLHARSLRSAAGAPHKKKEEGVSSLFLLFRQC
jgi:hypothetical protein